MKCSILFRSSVFFLIVSIAGLSQAADFPSKDIRMICPWDAGGGADGITRTISHYAQSHLPVSIYVENLTGGVTGPAVYEVMSSNPDGYTLGTITYDSVITVPRKKMIPGYDLKKLKYIANITREGYGLIVHKDAPWKTLNDLVADAKKRPKKIKIGILGFGGVSHLPLIEFEKMAGVEFRYIPYKGSAAENEALLMKEVDLISTSIGDAFSVLDSGDARGLAVMESVRNPKAPDCPTFKEEGYDLVRGSFLLIAAPAGVPDDRLKTLEESFEKAFNDPKFLAWAEKVGVEAAWMNSQDTEKFVFETQNRINKLMDELVEQGLLKE